ncbi:hypothetical protein [Nocardioides sp. GY 10113]|uniref:hypothetical protein n=1 Tax=Nocardioides sp. GY 10113 TaxID=2569761 RepID=UPI00197F54DD|nr:hypothetical protein [Nocardioides sp. GY 10113]
MHVFLRPTQRFLACLVCGGSSFSQRPIKLNTAGMSFFDLDWLNKSADGAICERCGYVHMFFPPAGVAAHQWLMPEQVRPEDLPDGGAADKAE